MKPKVASRSGLADAARLLMAGTLVIVTDFRFDQFDIIADAVGGVMVLVGIARVQSSVRGAEAVTTLVMVLAVIGLVASIIETVSVSNGLASILATAQPIGTVLLADVLVLWLAVVPMVAFQAFALASGGAQIETPLVIPLLMILSIPLITLCLALSRTARAPALEPTTEAARRRLQVASVGVDSVRVVGAPWTAGIDPSRPAW